MDKLKIKNYDVLIVRILQIIISFLISYAVLVLIALIVDREFINPEEFLEHILLFDAKPLSLAIAGIAWGASATATIAIFLIKRSIGQKIKDSLIMRKWMGLKIWTLSLGKDFE
ncbi:MAG: hypothetical protein FJ264_11955 [Planctomycetes bacterium]|nr:hypothetical protein [Planctomycetota bacterium]